MKILFVIHDTMLMGGSLNSFLTILDNLPAMVEEVYVLMPKRGRLSKVFAERKIPVWVMDYTPAWTKNHCVTMEDMLSEWNNIKCARRLAERLKKNNIDIVYTNTGIIDVGAMAAFFAGKRHIWHQREFIHRHYKRKYILECKVRWMLRHADAVVTVSKRLLRELQKRYHIKNGTVLYNKFAKELYYVENKELLSANIIRCLVTGTMYEGKRQLDAVNAIGRLIKSHHIAIELFLAGEGEAGYINKIIKYIKELGIQKQVHILKYETDMKSLRENMDIEISCSQWEGFGRTVIEGMLSGLFIIGANSGATSELIKHNKNGLLYQAGDADDLADKILWVCNHKEDAKHIARAGQQWASRWFLDDAFQKDLESILMNAN